MQIRGFLILFLLLTNLQVKAMDETSLSKDEKKIFLAILARNKAHVLPYFLECIDNQDYNKKLITVYINTNNNIDNTKQLLEEWAKNHQHLYKQILFEAHEVENLPTTNPHEWTPQRWSVLGQIRNLSLQKAKESKCDFYFVVDCDNFIAPCTLKTLVSKDKPIIAPLLRAINEPGSLYSNFFAAINEYGFYKEDPIYYKIMDREIKGTFLVPVVHCTYLIKSSYIDKLTYVDGSGSWEFVIFSKSARDNGVEQYICNEEIFGTLLHFSEKVTLEEEIQGFKMALDALKKPDDSSIFSMYQQAIQNAHEHIQSLKEKNGCISTDTNGNSTEHYK